MRVYLNVSLTLLSWKTTHFVCSLVGLQGGRRALEMNHQSILMGRRKSNKPSQNPIKRKRDTDESDESSDSEQTTQQSTSPPTLNIPHFLIVQSDEKDRKVSDLSPFAIEKCIQSIAGHPKV